MPTQVMLMELASLLRQLAQLNSWHAGQGAACLSTHALLVHGRQQPMASLESTGVVATMATGQQAGLCRHQGEGRPPEGEDPAQAQPSPGSNSSAAWSSIRSQRYLTRILQRDAGPRSLSSQLASDLSLPPSLGQQGFATSAPAFRKRRSPDEPQASGPKVSTTAPWPWVDSSRPFVLPVWVGVRKPVAKPLEDAISQVKANVTAALHGPPNAQLSGRTRHSTSDHESVELNITFLTDPRRSDQIVRGVVVLPHGSGKPVRIAVFAKGKAAEMARAAGADVVGDEDLIQQIITSEGEAIKFDVLIATPDFARPLARAGRVLGPKGLMPNPKMGTLTDDVASAVKAMRAGRLEFRIGRDKQMQVVVGKVQFTSEALQENVRALVGCILEQRPATLAGSGVQGYISKMYIKSSRTPVLLVDPLSCLPKQQATLKEEEQATPAGDTKTAPSAPTQAAPSVPTNAAAQVSVPAKAAAQATKEKEKATQEQEAKRKGQPEA